MTTKGEIDSRVSESSVSRSLETSRWRARAASAWNALAVVPLAVAGGLLTGALEALLDDSVVGLRAHAQATILAGTLGMALGVFLAPVISGLRGRGPVQRALAGLQRAMSRDRSLDRAPVLRLHAIVIATLTLLALWAGAAFPLFTFLLGMQEEGLAVMLAVLASSSMVALAALTRPLVRWLERPLAWIDRRWALPLPPQPGVRFFSLVAAPVFAPLIAFAHAFGDLLGLAGKLVGVPLVVVGAGVIDHVWRCVRPRARPLRDAVAPALLVAWCGGLLWAWRGGGQVALDRSSSPAAALGALLTRPLASRAVTHRESPASADLSLTHSSPASKTYFGLPSSDAQPYNIVWVIIDALRADAIGRVSAGQSITPQLDRLVSESIVFERAYSQAPATSYSIPSMLSGKNVEKVQWEWVNNHPQLPERENTIAERLQAHGYDTLLVASKYIRGDLKGVLQGYTKTVAASGSKKTKRAWTGRTAPLATVKSMAMIGELAPGPRPSRPFFLTVYYAEPHAPYINHEELGDRFPNSERGRYEAEVSFVDIHLGQLLEHLRLRAPLWERTIVIVTADHGEAFGEHGRKRHGGTCFVETVSVPLILRIPDMPALRIDTPVALVDIVPTLIELVGASREGAEELSGSSLLYPILGRERVDRERPIFCAAAQQRGNRKRYLQRTLRQDGYALFDWENGERVALYHSVEDPFERRDLIAEPAHAARAERMQQLLTNSMTGNIGQPPPR